MVERAKRSAREGGEQSNHEYKEINQQCREVNKQPTSTKNHDKANKILDLDLQLSEKLRNTLDLVITRNRT